MAISVQPLGVGGTGNNLSATTVATLTAGAAIGDTVVGWIWCSSAVTLTSVTDSKGNTYAAKTPYIVGSDRWIWVESVLTTALVVGDTITATFGSSAGRKLTNFVGLSGLAAAPAFDKQGAGATGASTTPSITTDPLAQADSVILAGLFVTSPLVTITEDADFTFQANSVIDNRVMHLASRIVSSSAADTYNPTISAPQTWWTNWTAYKGPTTPPPADDGADLLLLGVG